MTSAFYYLPTCILGSVVIVAAVGLVDTKVSFHQCIEPDKWLTISLNQMIVFMWRSKKIDFFMATCAFLLTVILGIEYGIASAFILSIVLGMLSIVYWSLVM